MPPASADYDNDGRADIAAWRPSTGTWYIINSSTGGVRTQQWGLPGDVPVPGDFDGDGRTEHSGVWRPSPGDLVHHQLEHRRRPHAAMGPATGDVPVPGDFDGDGRTDIAVWRPSTGTWYIINSSTGGVRTQQWGLPGDVPVPGDFDGDGRADIAVWRPSTGTWYTINSSTGGVRIQQWGLPGDMPVPGDYDGDGRIEHGGVAPIHRDLVNVINSSTGAVRTLQWGLRFDDIPVPGDYEGDGRTDIAVWRPSTGTWYIINSSSGTVQVQQWGAGGADQPLPGSF